MTKREIRDLEVTTENTAIIAKVLGYIPEIEAYSSESDIELNQKLDAEQRQGFWKDIETEIAGLDAMATYKGEWDSSDYFGWSSFTYSVDNNGRLSASDVAEALRSQRPYIENNMMKTIYYYSV